MFKFIKLYLLSLVLFVSFLQSLEMPVLDLNEPLAASDDDKVRLLLEAALEEQSNTQSIVISSHLKSGSPSIGAFLRSIFCCCCDTEEGDRRDDQGTSRVNLFSSLKVDPEAMRTMENKGLISSELLDGIMNISDKNKCLITVVNSTDNKVNLDFPRPQLHQINLAEL